MNVTYTSGKYLHIWEVEALGPKRLDRLAGGSGESAWHQPQAPTGTHVHTHVSCLGSGVYSLWPASPVHPSISMNATQYKIGYFLRCGGGGG